MIELVGMQNPCHPYTDIPLHIRITEPILLKPYVSGSGGGNMGRLHIVSWDGNGTITHYDGLVEASRRARLHNQTIREAINTGSMKNGVYWMEVK